MEERDGTFKSRGELSLFFKWIQILARWVNSGSAVQSCALRARMNASVSMETGGQEDPELFIVKRDSSSARWSILMHPCISCRHCGADAMYLLKNVCDCLSSGLWELCSTILGVCSNTFHETSDSEDDITEVRGILCSDTRLASQACCSR